MCIRDRCCPYFEELAVYLKKSGFRLGMVTNGTGLSQHAPVCSECFEKIYISVDGPEAVHDSIRGKGVFRTALEGRKRLEGPKVILMCVLTEETESKIQEIVDAVSVFEPDELILQQQIGLTEQEADRYADWMKREFSEEVRYIGTWVHSEEKERWLREQTQIRCV